MRGTIVHTVTAVAKGFDPRTGVIRFTPVRSSPGYEAYYPTFRDVAPAVDATVDGRPCRVAVKGFRDVFVVAEVTLPFDGDRATLLLDTKERLNAVAVEALLPFAPEGEREEFTFWLVDDFDDLATVVATNRRLIAQLVKDERASLTDEEIASAFDGALGYAEDDLAILDWDGGVILSREGAFDDDVAIAELANIQLLSLRTLDEALSRQFDRFRTEKLEGAMSVWKLSRTLRSVVGARAQSLLELDAIGDTMKLYGDWYDAKLYALASRKLSLGKWRETVEGKLATLEKMFEMVSTRQGELYNIILEVTIVVLIVIEIVLALMGHA